MMVNSLNITTQSIVKTDWKIRWRFIYYPHNIWSEVVQLPMYSYVFPLSPMTFQEWFRLLPETSHYVCHQCSIHMFDTIALNTQLFQVFPNNTQWFHTLFRTFDSSVPPSFSASSICLYRTMIVYQRVMLLIKEGYEEGFVYFSWIL